MGKIEYVSRLWVLSLMLFLAGGPSFSYAQWTDNGGSLTTSDNVGIGTTSPSHSLTVKTGNVVVEDTVMLIC